MPPPNPPPPPEKDTCQGDSGGPIWSVDRGSQTATLIGVVSRGGECAARDMPGVGTRINRHLEWLREKAGPAVGGQVGFRIAAELGGGEDGPPPHPAQEEAAEILGEEVEHVGEGGGEGGIGQLSKLSSPAGAEELFS